MLIDDDKQKIKIVVNTNFSSKYRWSDEVCFKMAKRGILILIRYFEDRVKTFLSTMW